MTNVFVILQGNMFAVTLYDTIYLYLKIASDVLKEGGTKSNITDGAFMLKRANDFGTKSGEVSYFFMAVNR